MRSAPRLLPCLAGLIVLAGSVAASAQDAPPVPSVPPPAPMSLKPLPPVAIPDDPPPHEGAFIDYPLTIQPPDIIVVEALESLPGRAISGEHLVRPDGRISLGFYGEVHVRGLTVPQAKAKIVLHLRRYLTDFALGLVVFEPNGDVIEAPMNDGPPLPEGLPQKPPGPAPGPQEPARVEPKPAPEAKPAPEPKVSARTHRSAAPAARLASRLVAQDPPPPTPTKPNPAPTDTADDVAEAFRLMPMKILLPQDGMVTKVVDPSETDRVFVEVSSFNSLVYFVQGDFGRPGRLPFTGQETVLDALNYAGGFTNQADPSDLHLHRPARGGAPARDYRIDYAAILRGDARANLQIFPGDRLVVGRNMVVARTIELDRATAPFLSVLNAAYQTAITARAIGLAGGEVNGTEQAARDATIRRYLDLLNALPEGKADGFDARRLLDAPPLPVLPRPGPPPR